MEEFAVFGNPVVHSKSPLIHKLFAEQTGIKYDYGKVLVPLNKFEEKLDDFFVEEEREQILLHLLRS